MFDPERVGRWREQQEMLPDSGEEVVSASDYDQLLEIHLRHVAMISGLFERCGEPLSEEKIAGLKNGTWR